jgi:hypothetical protein
MKLTQYAQFDSMGLIFGNEKEYEVIATGEGEYDDESKIITLSGIAKNSNIKIIITAERYAELP